MDERFYHDPQRKIMIWVAANEDDRTEADIALEKQQREDDGYTYRIVGSQDDLQEKLTLFDEELDDRIMEALKAVYTTQAQEQMSDLEIKDARIFKKDDKFCLQITGSRPLVAEIPMEQYESLKERAADLLDSDNSVIIDRTWAVSFLKKLDKKETSPAKKAARAEESEVVAEKPAKKKLGAGKIILIVALAVCVLAAAISAPFIIKSFSSDGMYYKYNMEKYMTVGDYSTEVDTDSAYYKEMYAEYYDQTFGTTLSYKKTEGVVADGDVVNIDYTGKKDGVAFEGGTDTGYDLTIGSNSFIDGFEEGLVGVAIGSTVDLNLTFPTNYHSADLAGKAVVFTVKVNYVTAYKPADEENVKEYGFDSLADYEKAAADFAAQYCIYNNIYKATTVNKYPDKELKLSFDSEVAYYKQVAQQNNMSYEDFIVANGMTVDSFETYLKDNYIKPSIMADMLNYYILQVNDQKLTAQEIEDTRADLEEQYGASALAALDNPDFTVQKMAAQEKAFKILLEQAKVK
ncbi:MAG: FKBP-type peptidyl-prolyl cis-trans isomerase [Clostridia bacterium]|nr:FKBP-type peptidyl-prolyl cis-trans isomerase [Clostridia bacterium]